MQRGLPVTRELWKPDTLVIAHLREEGGGITSARLWAITRRLFGTAATALAADQPALAEKLKAASPHWMRHTHATHALAAGAELTTVRDNLRHASISTTSTYLHGEDKKRAKQLASASLTDVFGKEQERSGLKFETTRSELSYSKVLKTLRAVGKEDPAAMSSTTPARAPRRQVDPGQRDSLSSRGRGSLARLGHVAAHLHQAREQL